MTKIKTILLSSVITHYQQFKAISPQKQRWHTCKYTLVYLPNLSKYLLHHRCARICFIFERPEGRGTRIFRARVRAKWSSLLHGVWCSALPSFQIIYSLHSPVGWSHGNSGSKYKFYTHYITLQTFQAIHFNVHNRISFLNTKSQPSGSNPERKKLCTFGNNTWVLKSKGEKFSPVSTTYSRTPSKQEFSEE